MSSDMPKLYESSSSPNSRRVRIFLAEKRFAVPRIPVDLSAGEQFSEAYRRIEPRRVVPALLIEDGTVVGEVPAILQYLEEMHPEPPLLGSSPKERALVRTWERRMELEGLAAVMETVRNKAPGLKGRAIAGPHDYEQIADLVTRGHMRIANFYADLETRLNEADFVAGDRFSVADITAVVAIDFATRALDLSIPEANGATKRWYAGVAARPSFAA